MGKKEIKKERGKEQKPQNGERKEGMNDKSEKGKKRKMGGKIGAGRIVGQNRIELIGMNLIFLYFRRVIFLRI